MDTYRVNLEELDAERYAGCWVDIKARRSYGDVLTINAALYLGVAAGGRAEIDAVAGALARLATAVVAWHLGEGAAELPPSGDEQRRAAFYDLDEDLGRWLLDQINTHYRAQRRPEAELKPSASGSSSTTPRRAARRSRRS